MIEKNYFIIQLDDIINEYKGLVKTSFYGDLSDISNSLETSSLLSKGASAIKRIAGTNSEYYKSIEFGYNEKSLYYNSGLILTHIVGIVKSLKDDISKGYLLSISELIHSDIFSDYLDMAQHLLDQKYKDPSAVIAGSTLENHLKKLCLKNGIELTLLNGSEKTINKKADMLNSDLCSLNVYNKIQKTRITSLLQLRNSAAHGNYDEYKIENIQQMINEIKQFIIEYPA